jgi:hypothetical protein
MYRSSLFFVSSLAVALIAAAPLAAQDVRTPQSHQTKRVWTNRDLDELRARGELSVVGQAPESVPASTKTQPSEPKSAAKPYIQKKDPAWYREQLAPLRIELTETDARIAELAQYRSATRYMVGGVIVPQLAGLPLNPGDEIRQLDAKRLRIISEINELHELARRNQILPGNIR